MYQTLFSLAIANILTFTSFANVELAHFNVAADKGNVNIEWTTLTEANCEFFVIERSLRFNQWIEITKIEALGSIDSGHSYNYTDESIPKYDMTYSYRISQMNENEITVVLEVMDVFVPKYIGSISNQEIDFSEAGNNTPHQDRSVSQNFYCDLTKFEVEKKKKNILFSWATSNEVDCYYFVIERQIGSGEWTHIHTAEAKGGIDIMAKYRWTEEVPAYDVINYQLKMSGVDEGFVVLAGTQIDLTNTVVTKPDDEMSPGRSGSSRVDLMDFNGVKKAGTAIFSFTTENEQNCHLFKISRSNDRVDWQQIDVVRALGATTNKYQMRDMNMSDEVAFYRLEAEDTNSNGTMLTELQMSPTPLNDISVYPNPANEVLFVEAYSGISQVSVTLSDLDGNILISSYRELPGRNTIDLSDIKEGIYVVTIRDHKDVITKKIVIDR